MKVLMTADAVGGVWTYALDLASGLADQGVRVVLAVMGPAPSAAQVDEARAVPGLVLEQGGYKLEWMDEPWDDVARAGRWLLGLADRHAPGLVHLNGFAHATLDWKVPVVVVAHSSVDTWWHAVHGTAPPPRYGRYAEAVHAGLVAADQVVAPTRATAAVIERRHGPLPHPLAVVHNGRARFVSPAEKEPRYLWTGRAWDEAKDVLLLEAAAEQGLPWPVDVVGSTEHPDGGADVKLTKVKSEGFVSGEVLRHRLARAKVYVSTARYEPFGLGPLEAAQAGCALVLPRIETFMEIWSGAARFYRPRDARALHEAMTELAKDPERARRFGNAARAVASRLTHSRMAAGYLRLYRGLTTPTEVVASAS